MHTYTNTKIIRLPEVKERTGLSRTTIYSLLKQGEFPAHVHLGARCVGWLEHEIDAWIAARVAAGRNGAAQPTKQ